MIIFWLSISEHAAIMDWCPDYDGTISRRLHPYPLHDLQRARDWLLRNVRTTFRNGPLRQKLGLPPLNLQNGVSSQPNNEGKVFLGSNKGLMAPTAVAEVQSLMSLHSSSANYETAFPKAVDNSEGPKQLALYTSPKWSCYVGLTTGRLPVQLILKCDLCEHFVLPSKEGITSLTASSMDTHLKNMGHYSASIYRQVAPDGVEVSKALMCKAKPNQPLKMSTILPMCPTCNLVFPDIFTCSMHDKHFHHSGINGTFGLAHVVHRAQISFKDKSCLVCGKSYTRAEFLHDHWTACPGHSPIQNIPEASQVDIYSCSECQHMYGSFINCHMHMITKHTPKEYAVKNHVYTLEMIILEKPVGVDIHPLPQFANSDMYRSALGSLCRFYKDFCVMNQARQKVLDILNTCKN
jgi:hypothetical protein